MKTIPSSSLKSSIAAASLAALVSTASAQEWQVVDTFEGGEPQGTWTSVGLPSVDTSAGHLDLRPTEGSNLTSALWVPLPQSFTEGKLTLAFDFYLPSGPEQNQVGFGVGSLAQAAMSGWGPTGTRNRFQMVNPPPQNLAKVPEWTSDILGETQQGVWYNIWLVYDLDADPNTITTYAKPASVPMETANLVVNSFDFNPDGNDDWSSIDMFATGIGLQDSPPEGTEPWDALGALFDNIYVSEGENVTLTPTSFSPEWQVVDTFSDGGPDTEWTADEGIAIAVEDGSLTLTGTAANAGLYTALPVSDLRSAFTVTFDLQLPGGGEGLNHIQFAVVGEDQIGSTGTALFGGNDRFMTFGVNEPQALANFGQWPPSLGPDLLGGTVLDQWYHVWLVYDGSGSTVDFYAVPVADPVDSVTLPEEPIGSFDLETEYADLGYLVLGTSLAGGNGMKVDNIYAARGESISLSPTAGELGGGGPTGPLTPNEWNQLDIGWVFGWTDVWGISTYMGYVYLADWPYIYQADLGWAYYVSSSGNDHYLYTWDQGWILINEGFGGYYYVYATDDYTQQIPQP